MNYIFLDISIEDEDYILNKFDPKMIGNREKLGNNMILVFSTRYKNFFYVQVAPSLCEYKTINDKDEFIKYFVKNILKKEDNG